MKIVVFSDLYPPLFVGGYEIGASQIVNELKRRGHEVLLLSSHEYHWQKPDGFLHRAHAPEDAAGILDTGLCVFGSLTGLFNSNRPRFLRKVLRTLWARRRYRAAIRRFTPDLLLAFNPLGVVAAVLDDFVAYSRKTGVPVNAYVSDSWLSTWPFPNPMWPLLHRFRNSQRRWVRVGGRLAQRVLGRLGLAPDPLPLVDRYLYCSAFIRDVSRPNSVAVAEHTVVHWGLPDVSRLPSVPADHFAGPDPLTLVYAGQLLDHKGLAVFVRALSRCRRPHRAVVIGDDQTEYAATCKKVAARLGVLDRLAFAGKKKHGEMLELLSRAGHVLVAPSVWDEPFSIVVLEGMGVGLPVVASNTGGTAEAITDGETGFLFPRGNALELAAVLDRLEADRGLCQRVGARARKLVQQRFTLERMVDQILATGGEARCSEPLAA